ncbi:MAG: hypothetical protein SynsKO_33070 [Synoicihabitans sp.]
MGIGCDRAGVGDIMNDVPMQVLLFLLLITAGQGLVLAAIVLGQKPRQPAFVLLGVFFLMMSLGCGEKAIEGILYAGKGAELPVPLAFPFVYLPLIYLHLRLLAEPGFALRRTHLLHFVPGILMVLASYYLVPGESIYGGFVIWSEPAAVRTFFRIYDVYFIAHFVAYLVALGRLRDRIVERPAEDPCRQWALRVLPVVAVLSLSWIFVCAFGKNHLTGYVVSYFIHGAAMVSIYGFGFGFLLQSKPKLARYLRSRQATASGLASDILERIRRSHIYRHPQVTVAKVAETLELSEKAVTSAVSAGNHANFNEFINRLRIDAFKHRATEPDARALSLFGIAQEVGFASKASFHRAFKKHCGQTPGEFLANQGS